MRKLLIIISAALLISTVVLGFFLWQKSKTSQQGETKTFLPITALGKNIEVKVQAFDSSVSNKKDPKDGNIGDIKLALDLDKMPFQASWPREYNLVSFKLIWLGFQKEISDNVLIWEFFLPEQPKIPDPKIKIPEFGKFPVIFGQAPIAAAVVKEFEPSFFAGKMGFRYLLEVEFQKQGNGGKIYKGVYGFTY